MPLYRTDKENFSDITEGSVLALRNEKTVYDVLQPDCIGMRTDKCGKRNSYPCGKRLIAVFLSFAVIAACFVFPAFSVETGKIGRYEITIPNDKMLPVREKASAASEKIGYLYNGNYAEVVEINGNWAKTVIGGKTGWFSVKYAKLLTEYKCAELIADIKTYSNKSSVDFKKLKDSGVSGVILRLGLSNNEASVLAEDSNFAEYLKNAGTVGLKIGAYFESRSLTKGGNVKECEWLKSELKKYKESLSLPVFYRPINESQKGLTQSENTDLVKAFTDTVKAEGLSAGVYLPYDWTSANINFDSLNGAARWIADFGDYCNFTKSFDIWQYSAQSNSDACTDSIGLSYMFNSVAVEPPVTAPDPSEEESSSETEPSSSSDVSSDVSTTAADVSVKHIQGEFTVTKQPSCTECGEERAYCTDCGKLMHIRLIAPKGHMDSKWVVVNEPSETEDGLAVRYCDICGEQTKEHILSAKGSSHIHIFGEWQYIDRDVLSEAGTTGPGEQLPSVSETVAERKKYVCNTDRVKVLKCLDCGKAVEKYLLLPEFHSPADEKVTVSVSCEGDGHCQTVCKYCKTVLDDVITVSEGHRVDKWEIIKNPSVNENGERKGYCSVCKKDVTEIIPKVDRLAGDADGDGKITSSDARKILRYSLKLDSVPDGAAFAGADYNGDGKISSSDARLVLRKALKLD